LNTLIAAPRNLPRPFFKLVTTVLVIIPVAVLSAFAGQDHLGVEPLLVLIATLGALLALHHTEVALILIPVAAVVLRYTLQAGHQSVIVASLVLAALLTGVWLIGMLLRKDFRLRPSPANTPLLLFAIVNILALLWGNASLDPRVEVWPEFPITQLGALGITLLSIGVFFLAANSIRDRRWVSGLVGVFLLLGTLPVLTGLLSISLPFQLQTGGLFPMWVIAMAYSQALFNHRFPNWVKVGLLLLTAAWCYRVFFVGITWISGWLPALVAIGAITFFRSKRLFILLMVVATIFVVVRWDFYYTAIFEQSRLEGDYGRLAAWSRNWSVTKDHLLLGTGPAGYALYYMTFFPGDAMATHSNYLDVLAQTGVLGLVAFAWFLFAVWRSGRGLWRREPDGFIAAFAAGVMGGFCGLLVAMALGDWFIPFVYTQTIAGFDYTVHSWLLLGTLVGISSMGAKAQEAGRQADGHDAT
jgi:hypothetical protein